MTTPGQAASRAHPSFTEAVGFWLKLGLISFGGPSGQIALMHTELVERRRWISDERFLHALNFCMLLPGPEAQQLAIYLGWLLHKTRGGIVAGVLFVLPSMVLLWGLSLIYVFFGHVPAVEALLYGLKPAVLAIVAAAVLRLGRRALKNPGMWMLAALSFACIQIAPFPLVIFGAALLGLASGQWWPQTFGSGGSGGSGGNGTQTPAPPSVLDDHSAIPDHARPSWGRAMRVLAVCLALWWIPVAALALWLGPGHALFKEAIFFSKAAMVTFGGAYAVLPYVSQQAVDVQHWLSAPQMLDGLGLAETTPGPLIIVLQFVGFLGGWNQPGTLTPILAATLGAFITTWTTFVPCFLWIFLGAPHIEQLRGNRHLGASLSAVTAAVVGVILNLALWFGARVLVPQPWMVDFVSASLATGAYMGLVRRDWGPIPVILGCGILGGIFRLTFA